MNWDKILKECGLEYKPELYIQDFKSFATALKDNKNIKNLKLYNLSILEETNIKDLSLALEVNDTLEYLDIIHWDLYDWGKYFADILMLNKSLKKFGLSYTFGSVSSKHLATALRRNNTLKELYLSSCNITDMELIDLCESLKVNTSLEVIHLNGNKITCEGVRYLSEMLKMNRTLKSISISDNLICDKGAEYLSEAIIKNDTLTTLWLSSNHIDDYGAFHIAKALKINKSLSTFYINENRISITGVEYLIEGLKENFTLKKFCVFRNGGGGQSILLAPFLNIRIRLQYMEFIPHMFNSYKAKSKSEILAVMLARNYSIYPYLPIEIMFHIFTFIVAA